MIDTCKERKNITLNEPIMDLLMTMSEGNPGGLTVMMKMIDKGYSNGLISIFHLDDMNIRGTQIWIGYKDYCGEDIDKFIECVNNHDENMIDKINEEGMKGNHEHKAVKQGASFLGKREFLKD